MSKGMNLQSLGLCHAGAALPGSQTCPAIASRGVLTAAQHLHDDALDFH